MPIGGALFNSVGAEFDDAVMGHFVDHLSRDVQPKGCDVTVLNYASRRHTCERVPNA